MKALILSTLLAMGHFSAVADTEIRSFDKKDKEVTVEDYGEKYELYYQDRIINGGITGGNARRIRKDLRPGNMENLHRGKKEIVITIDDGPTPGVTDKVLDALKKHNVQATFFVIGSKAKRYTSLMERIANEGHIIANHTMTHPKVGKIKGWGKKKKIREEIIGAHELLRPYLANGKRWYFRPPYASWQSDAAKIINKTEYGHNYYGPLLWDIGGEMETKGIFKKPVKAADWACWSKKWSVKKCLKGYVHETEDKKGGVVLFHDLVSKSAELIDGYLEEFSKKDDYRFISLDDVPLD